jgi:hypothetical protein
MAKPSKEILDFMAKHSIASDEIWEVHGNSWCIKHKALERAGAAAGIIWDRPAMIEVNSAAGVVAICVFGKLGDRVEWSIGEASPKNNKNAYCYAMAEKRGKDRVILKLLNTHGYLYSEAEFDADEKPAVLAKKDAKEIYLKLQKESREAAVTVEAFKDWMAGNVERINILPEDWQNTFRLQCQEILLDLRQGQRVA